MMCIDFYVIICKWIYKYKSSKFRMIRGNISFSRQSSSKSIINSLNWYIQLKSFISWFYILPRMLNYCALMFHKKEDMHQWDHFDADHSVKVCWILYIPQHCIRRQRLCLSVNYYISLQIHSSSCMMFDSSLPPVVCRIVHVLFTLFVFVCA
jgi:hypothetical protein